MNYVPNNRDSKARSNTRIVIDRRPNAVVGNMLLTKPTTEKECDEYVVAMITGIAEVIAPDTGYDVVDVATFLASYLGCAMNELYTMAADEQESDWF